MHKLDPDALAVDSFDAGAPASVAVAPITIPTTILVTRGLGCTEYSCYTDCGGATVTICPATATVAA